jgi:hypothetical protein
MNVSQYVLDRRANPELMDEKDHQRLAKAEAKRERRRVGREVHGLMGSKRRRNKEVERNEL